MNACFTLLVGKLTLNEFKLLATYVRSLFLTEKINTLKLHFLILPIHLLLHAPILISKYQIILTLQANTLTSTLKPLSKTLTIFLPAICLLT